ncbi:MAG TPA: hypothetical protein VF472_13640 [Burkholderiaceae bacterium]
MTVEQKIDELRETIVLLVSAVEKRTKAADMANERAVQNISQVSKDAANSAIEITESAMDKFKSVAAGVVTDGLNEPMKDYEKSLQSRFEQLQKVVNKLEMQCAQMRSANMANAWKAFVASTVASLAIIGVAVYVSMKTHEDMQRSEWIGSINAAVANGKLVTCPDGGICAMIKDKPVHLDR